MPFQSRMFYLVVLIASSLLALEVVAENSHGELATDEQTAADNQVVDVVDKSKTSVISKSDKEATKQEGRSIKMIVGGQSEHGVAKEVTVPVQD